MKIIKLSNRFNAKKKYGYEIGVKFNSYWDNGSEMEHACRNVLGNSPYFKTKHNLPWYAQTGLKRDPKTEMYPYWIYFKKESYLTMVLLKLEKDN